jgi:hypothetical protein
VWRPRRGALPEVVACGPRDRTARPPRRRRRRRRYRFASATTSYAPAQLARVARDLRRRPTGAPTRSSASSPGSPHALTVLTGARSARLGWSSWHVYPEAGEVVRTRSRLDAP